MSTEPPNPGNSSRIAAIRRFNRFYTKQIGVLHEGLLRSPFSLTEVRILYELAHNQQLTAAGLSKELGVDAGYLSRILSGFEKKGLLQKKASAGDRRRYLLALTPRGREVFEPLEARSQEEVDKMLFSVPEPGQRRLIEAMHTIEQVLGGTVREKAPYMLRTHQPGDMGWVVHRHGVLYSHEYGWDERFEALVAEVVAQFIKTFDARRERCWIAERDGEIVGSVFLVNKSEQVAKLRLLLVEPSARGLGIGTRLVAECIRFARQVGYKQITLWTQSNLLAARKIYKKAGFRLVNREINYNFGHDLISETWELNL